MAGSIFIPLLSALNDTGIKQAQKQLGSLGGTLEGVKRAFGVASASVVAYNAAQAGLGFAKDSVIAARDLSRNFAALDSVFGPLSAKMQQFSNDSVKIGLSSVDAAKASTFLGSVLKQAGFSMDDVADQTQNLVGLASDLATTYGYDVQEALTGMTALFRGEYDPIEKFGVAMKQSEVNAVLAANGQDKLQGAARRNAEQMARLALLYQRTEDAQGAFATQSGTLFVEQKKLEATFKNIQATVGSALIPVLSDLATQMVPIVTNLAPVFVEVFKQISSLLAVFVPLLDPASKNMQTLGTVFAGLVGILKDVLTVLIKNIAAVLAFVTAFSLVKNVGAGVLAFMKAYRVAAEAATVAQLALNGAAAGIAGIGIGAAAVGVGIIAAGMVAVATDAELASDKVNNFYKENLKNATVLQVAVNPNLYAYSGILGSKFIPATDGASDAVERLAKRSIAAAIGVSEASRELDQFKKRSLQLGGTGGVVVSPADDMAAKLKALLANFTGAVNSATSGSKASAAKAATDYIKDFYANLADENRKQMARIRLQNAGASDALIESIIGSGEGWNKVYQSIISGGEAAVAKVQALFNTTKAGLAEIEELAGKPSTAIKDFYKGLEDEVAKQTARLKLKGMGASEGLIEYIVGSGEDWQKVYDSIVAGGVEAFNKLKATFAGTASGAQEAADAMARVKEEQDRITAALADFDDKAKTAKESFEAVLATVGKIGSVSVDLGTFENEVVSAFAKVQDSITSALDNKVITDEAAANLRAYADQELAVMQALGAKRDALAKKRSLVQALMDDVKQSFMTFASITGKLETASETVTQTSMQMINGLQVTVSKTFQVTKQTASVAENFKTMVDKARNFVSVLRQLKASGLNAELFKQIVDAGVESGTATAEGILAGGPAAVAEINGLFADLQDISGQAAELTAVVMYNDGVEVAGGFLNGLLSQEEAFRSAAATLASAFATTLNSMVTSAIAAARAALAISLEGDKPIWEPEIKLPNNGIDLAVQAPVTSETVPLVDMYDPSRYYKPGYSPSMLLGSGDDMPSQPIVLQLDNKVVAEAMLTYERTNGKIWARAVAN